MKPLPSKADRQAVTVEVHSFFPILQKSPVFLISLLVDFGAGTTFGSCCLWSWLLDKKKRYVVGLVAEV